MQEADAKQFSEQLALLWSAWGREPSKLTIRAWWLGLKDLSIDTVERAMREAIREADTMPTVAKLRRLARGLPPRDKTPADVLRERQERDAEAERVWGSWNIPDVGANR